MLGRDTQQITDLPMFRHIGWQDDTPVFDLTNGADEGIIDTDPQYFRIEEKNLLIGLVGRFALFKHFDPKRDLPSEPVPPEDETDEALLKHLDECIPLTPARPIISRNDIAATLQEHISETTPVLRGILFHVEVINGIEHTKLF